MVPMYAPEVTRIEILDSDRPTRARVRSHLKIAGLTFTFLYRYHYRAPVHYSGVQESGLLRGYFSLRFAATAKGASAGMYCSGGSDGTSHSGSEQAVLPGRLRS
jgi:hypothetical protein